MNGQNTSDGVDFTALREVLRNNRFEHKDIGPINELDEIDIFVISPPKCGTTALQRGFERLGRKVLHAHNDSTTYAAFQNGQLLADAGVGLGMMVRYRRLVGRGPIYVFCGYREPVSWYLSVAGHFSLPLDNGLKTEIIQRIANHHPWRLYPFADTRSAIESGVGFDILAQPFDCERGYSIIHCGDVNLILYRYDQIGKLTSYIHREIDDRFTLNPERVNSKESYLDYVRNFRLDLETCQYLYSDPIFNHFLSPQDRLDLIKKYTDY